MKFKKTRVIFICTNLLLAIIGCIRIYRATNWGVWAFSDSASYFSAARNLMEGQGMIIKKANGGVEFFQQFPPLYPFVLGVAAKLLNDPFAAARWINIFAFGAFLFLSGQNMFVHTKGLVISLAAPALLLVSPMMITNFTGAMTEPIFFVLMMLSFLLVYCLIKTPDTRLQILYVIISALLPVTRYAGIVVVAANSFLLLAFMQTSFKKRLSFFFISVFISALPTLIWLANMYTLTDRIGGRSVQMAATFFGNFCNALEVMYGILPSYLAYHGIYEDIVSSGTRFVFFLVGLSGLLCLSISMLLKRSGAKISKDLALEKYFIFPLHACAFFIFIAFSYSITLRSYVIDQRQLSPLIPITLLFIIDSLSVIRSALKNHRALFSVIILVLFAFVVRFTYFSSRNLVRNLYENGDGFTARQYQQSGIIDVIKSIPEDKPIISNSAGFILLHDNRYPLQVDQFNQHKFGSGNTYGERTFREREAALVLLLSDFHNYYGARSEELLSALTEGLNVAYQDAVGAIFYYPE